MKQQRTYMTLLFIAVVIFLSSCSPATETPALEPQVSHPDTIIAEGRLLPINELDQAFSVPGQVSEVLVEDGARVSAGQVLARLKVSPDAQLALLRAQQELLAAEQAMDALGLDAVANLANARLAVIKAQNEVDAAQEKLDEEDSEENRADLEVAQAALGQAQKQLAEFEDGEGIDTDQLRAVDARLSSARAAVDAAQAFIDAHALTASMDGSVVDLSLQAGQWISAGQPVIKLADYSSWVVKTDNLTEDEVVSVKAGQAVTLVFDALPDAKFDGEVRTINARYEEKRGDITYTVTIGVPKADDRLRWGMTAAVQFIP